MNNIQLIANKNELNIELLVVVICIETRRQWMNEYAQDMQAAGSDVSSSILLSSPQHHFHCTISQSLRSSTLLKISTQDCLLFHRIRSRCMYYYHSRSSYYYYSLTMNTVIWSIIQDSTWILLHSTNNLFTSHKNNLDTWGDQIESLIMNGGSLTFTTTTTWWPIFDEIMYNICIVYWCCCCCSVLSSCSSSWWWWFRCSSHPRAEYSTSFDGSGLVCWKEGQYIFGR